MTTLFKIYLDMDGVLADFDARVEGLLGRSPALINDNELWSRIKDYNDNYYPFFEHLPMMEGALLLFDMARTYHHSNVADVKILTATGYSIKDADEQKRTWVRKNLSTEVEVLTVVSSKDKAQYADPHSILIDDREAATKPWEEAGGIAIKYNSSIQAIMDLDLTMTRLLGEQ